MILSGATLVDADGVRRADLRIQQGVIVEVGAELDGPHRVDLRGKWLMPGLVCAHHHLYSALATGMPLKAETPRSFKHMLELVWWRLDAALDLDAINVSALVGGVAALRAGVTTIVDHHASPNAIEGSLEAIDGALNQLGLRRVLCYEVTDRGGPERARAGLKAHEKLLAEQNQMRAVMIGAHACFTLSDETLIDCAQLAKDAGVGLHIHAAEAVDDPAPVVRLDRLGALLPGSILAHGVHLDDDEVRMARDAGAWITHQPRSNQNNGLGYARPQRFGTSAALGTDGIGSDMLAELQAGWYRGQEDHAGISPHRWKDILFTGNRLAGEKLGVELGRLVVGGAADLVVLDPVPGPPLTDENLGAALIYRFASSMVRDVMVNGVWALRDRMPAGVDANELDVYAQATAQAVWARMEG